MTVRPVNTDKGRFATALGDAVLAAWDKLPRDVQEMLFEQAVVCGHHDERDEALREQLAEFLHDNHPRTAEDRGSGGQPPIGEVEYAEINSKG